MTEQVGPSGASTVLIHYVFRAEPERIACMPNMAEFHSTPYHPNYQRTNDPRAVTCKSCKDSEEWFTAMQAAQSRRS